jgi:hypothetical protein
MSAVAPLPALVPIPAVSDALGFSESRPTYRALERFGIPIVRISPRRIAIRRSDFEVLLQKASANVA